MTWIHFPCMQSVKMSEYIKKNYHTHTARCKHAVGEDREYVESAIRQGIQVLGFSDHIPVSLENDTIQNVRMSFGEVEGYFDSFLQLKQEYRKDIDIHIGFEGEYFPSVFEEQMSCLRDYPVEYVILGQHFLKVGDKMVYSGWGTDSPEVLKSYVDSCIEALSTGAYCYLAHPDLIHFSGDDRIWDDEMRRLLTFCKENRYPVEYNLLGALENRPYPSVRCYEMIGQIGNEVILGIDAHSPQQIGDRGAFDRAKDFIKRFDLRVVEGLRDVAGSTIG